MLDFSKQLFTFKIVVGGGTVDGSEMPNNHLRCKRTVHNGSNYLSIGGMYKTSK